MRHLLFALLLAACAPAAAASRGPVVLELFTSEGCSSCPPADALLASLADRTDVIALELHVDYWDQLGWKDPFSQPLFSDRQALYDRTFGKDDVYTPQIIVNGVAETVGSNRSQILRLLSTVPPATAPISVDAHRDGDSIVISARPPQNAQLLIAITETGLSTQVLRGENAGKTLAHGPIVRRLEPIPSTGTLRIPSPARRQTLIALLQDRQSLRILGATRLSL